MGAIDDLIGANGVIKQMLLWNVVGQVVSALAQPGFEALSQDVNSAHPLLTLDAATMAQLSARGFVSVAAAEAEAAKTGIDKQRFALLAELATVRLAPADLATAVLRSYMTAEQAQAIATPQGYTPADMAILADLAGDAPGADQLAAALLRGIIPAAGTGPSAVSYEQGIKETRLHDKWAPVLEQLSKVILSPADAADAVVRNFTTLAAGEATAAKSGMSAADFTTLTHLAGDAPGPQQLAEALRRGVIPDAGTGAGSTSFEQGIAEGRLADKWAPVIQALAREWPTPANALRATLQGQVSMADGLALYERLGGDPQFFQVMFDAEGSSPTPLELIQMANRGIIPWTGAGPAAVSYEQGFLEGPWRDKWSGPYKALGEYVPPIGTVTNLLAKGVITSELASQLLAKQGMSADLIAAYVEDAHLTALSEWRGLSQSVAVDAYRAHLITPDQLHEILASLHVTEEASALIIEYADFQRAFAQVTSAVSRIRALYTGRKITAQTATEALTALDIPAASVTEMMATWSLVNSINVKELTVTEIAGAFGYKVLTQAEAVAELVNIGYTPYDAWLILSVHVKGILPDKPEPGPAPALGQVVPGTA
jgi:hypothetical protein